MVEIAEGKDIYKTAILRAIDANDGLSMDQLVKRRLTRQARGVFKQYVYNLKSSGWIAQNTKNQYVISNKGKDYLVRVEAGLVETGDPFSEPCQPEPGDQEEVWAEVKKFIPEALGEPDTDAPDNSSSDIATKQGLDQYCSILPELLAMDEIAKALQQLETDSEMHRVLDWVVAKYKISSML